MAVQEPFMRAYVGRWLDDPKIVGVGDDGQREGGITLAQEAVYWRLCCTQFRQSDGYLPNRRAFLCDASACASAEYKNLVVPVLERFFRKTKDGTRLFNMRTRDEWEAANSKGVQARAAAEERWKRRRSEIASEHAGVDADAYADAPCKKEKESEKDKEKESKKEIAAPLGQAHPLPFDLIHLEPYCIAWRERWGQESQPSPRAWNQSLAEAERLVGVPESIARWVRYLAAETAPKWCRADKFLEALGTFGKKAVAPARPLATEAGGSLTADERKTAGMREGSRRFLDRHRGSQ